MSKTRKFVGTEVPTYLDVKYFNARIQPSEAKDISAQTDFQWQIVKTRFLIWKYDELLAAPVIGRQDTIYIIVPHADTENGKLVKFAKESNITLSGPYYLSNDIYQLCITYSIGFRLSPLWNQIGNLWIQSLDFLISVEPLPAVTWEPIVAGGYLRATIQATRARIDFLDLNDYAIDIELLKRTGRAPISGTAYVLPKQRLCHLVNVLATIPYDCPFPTYSLLRKHWKNTYGLRLPHDGSSMLYVQVRFGWKDDLYTYPILCVRPSKLRRMPSRNVEETVTAFLDGITERCKTVCGKPIEFKIFDCEMPISLQSSQNQTPLSELSYRRSLITSILSQSITLSKQEKTSVTELPSKSPQCQNNVEMDKFLIRDKESLLLEEKLLAIPTESVSVANAQNQENKTKFVPTFSKQLPLPKTEQALPGENKLTGKNKFIPVFKPRVVAKPSIPDKLKTEHLPKQSRAVATNSAGESGSMRVFLVDNLSNDLPEPIATSTPTKSPPTQLKALEPTALLRTESATSDIDELLQLSLVPKIAKAQVQVVASPAKIRRPNPPPLDIALLAKSKLLSKATVSSLKAFCKDHKISGFSRDKKEVLTEKVYRYFGITIASEESTPIHTSGASAMPSVPVVAADNSFGINTAPSHIVGLADKPAFQVPNYKLATAENF